MTINDETKQAIINAGNEFYSVVYQRPFSPEGHVWDVVLDNAPQLAKIPFLWDSDNVELRSNDTIVNTIKAMKEEAKEKCSDAAYLACIELVKVYLPSTWKAVERLNSFDSKAAPPVVDSVVFTPAKQGLDLLSADKDKATCLMSDGYEFSWWGDEIQFTEAELVGLTVKEIDELYSKKDIEYLQS